MIIKFKSLVSLIAVLVSSTALMAAYTVPVWKPADVLKQSNNGLVEQQEVQDKLNADEFSISNLQDAAAPVNDAGKHIKTHRVRLSSDGFVPGKITVLTSSGDTVNVEGADVLLIKNGNVVTQATTNESGNFQLQNAGVGEYSFFVVSPKVFMAYGIEVIAPITTVVPVSKTEDGEATLNVSVNEAESAELSIKSAGVPPQDFKAIYDIVDQYMPNLSTKSSLSALNTTNAPVPDQVSELSAEPIPVESFTKKYEPDVTISYSSVLLSKDKELIGRVRRYHPTTGQPIRLRKMQAFLIQNGKYMKAPIREDGRFVFSNIEPGTYSFAAAGQEGFSAFSLNAVSNPGTSLAAADIPRELVLNMVMLEGSGTGGTLTSEEDAKKALEEQKKKSQGNNNGTGQGAGGTTGGTPGGDAGGGNTGGGNTGGGGGGIGGGGGGGLLGAALGAGGLAAGIAALNKNDNKKSP